MLGIELALADVEFTDGRLAHQLLTREVRRAVTRSFKGGSCTVRNGTPHGQQDPINFGPGYPQDGGYPQGPEEETPDPKARRGDRWYDCWCCCDGRDCCCDCDGCCCDCGDCCDCT